MTIDDQLSTNTKKISQKQLTTILQYPEKNKNESSCRAVEKVNNERSLQK